MPADTVDSLLGAHLTAVVHGKGRPAETQRAIAAACAAGGDLAAGLIDRHRQLEALAAACSGEAGLQQRCSASLTQLKALRDALM